jgi:hypothetical protein
MTRIACALAGLMALVAPSPVQFDPRGVDGVAFALAFRAGSADRFRHRQVSGTGTNFHGAIRERIGDGSTRTSLVVTLGAADPDGKLTLLRTWDDFVAAERARTTLVVALSGPDLPAPPAPGPAVYEFSGVYDGQVRTIMRVPQTADGGTPDSGPCPGEQPRQGEQQGSFYCAPLLTGATAAPRR